VNPAISELTDLFQLLLQFFDSDFDPGEFVAFFLDHVGRGFVEEVAVGEFAFGALIFMLVLVDLLAVARLFGLLVDEAAHGDEQFHFADQGRRRIRGPRL